MRSGPLRTWHVCSSTLTSATPSPARGTPQGAQDSSLSAAASVEAQHRERQVVSKSKCFIDLMTYVARKPAE